MRSFACVIVLCVFVLCGCSGDVPSKNTSAAVDAQTAGFPKTVKLSDGREVLIPSLPKRIVAANCSAADILAELADIESIAAVPSQVEMYSPSASFWRQHPEPKTGRFDKYQAETLLGFKPDLVISSALQDAGTTAALERMKVPILALKDYESFDDIRAAMLAIGEAIGREQKAKEKVKEFDERLKRVAKQADGLERVTALFYSNLGTGYTFGAATCQHDMLAAAGTRDAAADAGIKGLAPISFEQLLRIDPEWLVVCGESGIDSPQVRVLLNEPALRGLRAVKSRQIAVVPTRNFDALSQYAVDVVEILARQIHPVASRPKIIPLH